MAFYAANEHQPTTITTRKSKNTCRTRTCLSLAGPALQSHREHPSTKYFLHESKNTCLPARICSPLAASGEHIRAQHNTTSKRTKNAVELRGLEPRTPCLQSRCSSQLSYSPDVGLAGVEPATSRLSGVRSNQPELQAHGWPAGARRLRMRGTLRPETRTYRRSHGEPPRPRLSLKRR